MTKYKTMFLGLAMLGFLNAACADDAAYTKARWFIEKVLTDKGAHITLDKYSKKLSLVTPESCEVTLQETLSPYNFLNFKKSEERQIRSSTFSAQTHIEFIENESHDTTKVIMSQIREYDCEEEGCSQSTVITNVIDSNKIRIQDIEQMSAGNYVLMTHECTF